MIKLLITDLDDTLYPWLDSFVPAFYAMAGETARILGLPLDTVLREFKQVHTAYGDVEHPFAAAELPSVRHRYAGASEEQLRIVFAPALQAFASVRKQKLRLLPGVYDTLRELHEAGIKIAGYTDAGSGNGLERLRELQIEPFFDALYVTGGLSSKEAENKLLRDGGHAKPNPAMLRKICRDFRVREEETIYTGDSMTCDMLMAAQTQVHSAQILWEQEHRKKEVQDNYRRLVAITNWTEQDFSKDEALRRECRRKNVRPEFTVSCYSEIREIIARFAE
jgi:phosphoglycolate phosphatase